jgi:hypothetical protein
MDGRKQGLRVCALSAVLVSALLVGSPYDAKGWVTITVNSLADLGTPGICALRDAINAANTRTATNGCAAGNGNDTIKFSVTGTILLTNTLPEITDSQLTINGPASPGITISGDGKVQVMQISSTATLTLKNLTIADGFAESDDGAGGLVNQGTLTVTNSIFSDNIGGENSGTGAVVNLATLTVINSTFSDNKTGLEGGPVGGIYNLGTLTITNSTFSGNGLPSSVINIGNVRGINI